MNKEELDVTHGSRLWDWVSTRSKRTRTSLGITAVVAAICALALGISISLAGTSTTAVGTFGTTHPNAGYYRAHAYDHTETVATVKTYNKAHQLINTQVFTGNHARESAHTAAQQVKPGTIVNASFDSGTGGNADFVGYTKVTITKYLKSLLGFKLAYVRVWIEWGWDNGVCCNGVVVHDKGRSENNVDSTWHWDKWLDGTDTYFQWKNGFPHSGFKKMGKGQFHGPCISTNVTCQVWLRAYLVAHSNGTNYWETSGND